MNYTKPEVAVLGKAAVVIENSSTKHVPAYLDSLGDRAIFPAYDLDE